jgi:hypothetical protein
MGWLGLAGLAAGCAGPYDNPSTSTYVIGALFILVGLALGYAAATGSR